MSIPVFNRISIVNSEPRLDARIRACEQPYRQDRSRPEGKRIAGGTYRLKKSVFEGVLQAAEFLRRHDALLPLLLVPPFCRLQSTSGANKPQRLNAAGQDRKETQSEIGQETISGARSNPALAKSMR